MADIFSKWKEGLERTRKVAFGRIATLFGATEVTAATWDELESILVQADMGIDTTDLVIAALRKRIVQEGITRSDEMQNALRQELINLLIPAPQLDFSAWKPAVILLVGVNGSGKTTAGLTGIWFVLPLLTIAMMAASP